jgi:hypothetical protein
MGTLVQSVLPFRVEDTDKLLTANTELTLFGKFVYGLERLKNLIRKMPIIMHLSQTTLADERYRPGDRISFGSFH